MFRYKVPRRSAAVAFRITNMAHIIAPADLGNHGASPDAEPTRAAQCTISPSDNIPRCGGCLPISPRNPSRNDSNSASRNSWSTVDACRVHGLVVTRGRRRLG
ncbi:hypothetical protein FRAAL0436 [Frankia alni ACN14a]|uniref:Uncharacterized protein n=1 Tax=Frankia alni (strain DSM 45986 / CECT 9034 / ACN14a) TaxID=326424 RepID=Q0RTI7_FRAAA|nr:hypothetical protein FRAAL0436 [Frankia alni ACN14a]